MALTATFAADFSKFSSSLQKASIELQTFDRATKTAAKGLQATMELLSGQKLAVEAARMAEAVERIGGASKLTQAELKRLGPVFAEAVEKARALGEKAPASITKLNSEIARLTKTTTGFTSVLGPLQKQLIGVFSVGAATAAVRSFVNMGSAIQDLSQKTGISTAGIQKLKLAFESSGVSIDTVATSVNKLGIQLVTADKTAGNALKQIGLSGKELINLNIDQAFLKVVDAAGKLQNPIERATALQQIFGRQGLELLPGVTGELVKTIEQYERLGLILSDDVIKAADQFGDTLGVLKTAGMAFLAQVLTPLLPGLTELARMLGGVATIIPTLSKKFEELIAVGLRAQVWLFDFAAGAAELSTKIPTLRNAFGESAKDVQFFREQSQIAKDTLEAFTTQGVEPAKSSVKGFTPVMGEYGKATDAATRSQEAFNKAVQGLTGVTALKEAEDAIKKIAAAGGAAKVVFSQLPSLVQVFERASEAALTMGRIDLSLHYAKLAKELSPVVQLQQRYNVTIGDYIQLSSGQTEAVMEQAQGQNELNKEISLGIVAIKGYIAAWAPFKTAVESALTALDKSKWARAWAGIREGLSETLESIPQTIANAFIGGGDIIGAIKAIASQIGATIGKEIGGVFGKLGGILGGALGSLLGPLVGKVANFFKGLFGVSDEIKKARQDLEAFQKTLQQTATNAQLNEAAGRDWALMLITVRDAFKGIGRSAEEAERLVAAALDTDNAERSAAAIREITKAFEELQQNARTASGIFDDILDLARDAGLPEFLQPYIDQLIELGLLTEDQIAALRGLSSEGSANWKKIEEAASKYGIRLESLGQPFNAQRIATDAAGIINAFNLIVDAGGDVGGVLFDMREEISKVVADSKKFGTTIPENMKPWIEELLRAGLLVDENGEALTDLGGIKYGEKIKTEAEKTREAFEKIIDRIEELIEKITGPLLDAFDRIPDEKRVRIVVDTDGIPDEFRPPDLGPSSQRAAFSGPSSLSRSIGSALAQASAQSVLLAPVFINGRPRDDEVERVLVQRFPGMLATGPPRAAVKAVAQLAARDEIHRAG